VPILGANLDLERCPYCEVDSPNLRKVHNFETDNYKGSHNRVWLVYVCSRCGGVIIASSGVLGGPALEIYPAPKLIDKEIPSPAFEYLQQAIESIHAPAGAVMLAASAVDAMLKNKGYTTGSLYSRIDKAAEDNLITKEMAKWAHEVRLDANDQRHADISAKLPEQQDAKRVIDFTVALGQFMFVLPAKVIRGLEGK
jgi:hypothetical protein